MLVGSVRAGPRVEIDLDRGANIVSLRDRFYEEWLATGEDPEGATSDFAAAGLRGYDDCFPSISAVPDDVDDHGVLWSQPWRRAQERTSDDVWEVELTATTPWRGITASRELRLTPDGLGSTTILHNTSGTTHDYLWAGHLLLGTDEETRVRLPSRPQRLEAAADVPAWDAPESAGLPGVDDGTLHWARVPIGSFAKLFFRWPTRGVVIERHGRRANITSDEPWLGVWINRGGFPEKSPHHHLGVEPSTSDADDLRQAIDRGTSRRLAAGDRAAHGWSCRFS